MTEIRQITLQEVYRDLSSIGFLFDMGDACWRRPAAPAQKEAAISDEALHDLVAYYPGRTTWKWILGKFREGATRFDITIDVGVDTLSTTVRTRS